MGKTIEDVFLEVMKNRTNGLAVLEVPTGRGKTHSAISAIRKILQDENGTKRRVYFVSPQLKNLPKGDQLRKVFAGDEYAWLRLERNSKSVEENLPSLFPFLPECVKKIPACQDLLCLIRQYREARKHAGSGNIGESGNNFVEKDGDDSLIPQKMDEAGSRLDVMLKVPGFREYMESHGYRTEFGNGRYVMTPAFYNNVYKGALGEIFCDFFSKSLAIRFT